MLGGSAAWTRLVGEGGGWLCCGQVFPLHLPVCSDAPRERKAFTDLCLTLVSDRLSQGPPAWLGWFEPSMLHGSHI